MPRNAASERDDLARELIGSEALRSDVAAKAASPRHRCVSDGYPGWRRRVRTLARRFGVPESEMTAAVVERAIVLARHEGPSCVH